jgi:hypothetical protein
MFTLAPRSLFSWDFDIARDGARTGSLRIDWFSESGRLELDGRTWLLGREGWMSGAFYVAHGGGRVATAEKPSAFARRFDCALGAERAVWRAESALARAFVLERNGRPAGTLRPDGWATRASTLDLPADLADEVQLFLAWLALLQWRRAQQN